MNPFINRSFRILWTGTITSKTRVFSVNTKSFFVVPNRFEFGKWSDVLQCSIEFPINCVYCKQFADSSDPAKQSFNHFPCFDIRTQVFIPYVAQLIISIDLQMTFEGSTYVKIHSVSYFHQLVRDMSYAVSSEDSRYWFTLLTSSSWKKKRKYALPKNCQGIIQHVN